MPWFDGQAHAWQTAQTETCLAGEVHDTWDADLLDRGLWCLEERRMEFEALVTELSSGEARSLEAAVPAAAGLRQVGPCRDGALLRRAPSPPKERRDEIRSVRTALSRAAALQRTGAYDQGIAVARDALSGAEGIGWPPLVAKARFELGGLLERAGDYAQAEGALEAAYFEATEAGAFEVALDAAAALVYTVGVQLARHQEGLRWSRHAEIALAHLPDFAQIREAGHLSNLAVVHHSMGSFEEATKLHERALAINENTLGPDHPSVASSLNNLANVYCSTGAWETARPLYERALAIRKKTLGPDHPHVATTLNNLANLHTSTGSHETAMPLYERALAIKEAALGSDHADVAANLSNIALLHNAMGSYDEAKKLHQRALEIWETVLGPEHPKVALSLNNLARLHYTTGSFEEAQILYERALTVREKALGPEHPDLAPTLLGLGRIALAQERASDAMPLLERALKLRENGTSSPSEIAAARFLVAQALWDAHRERPRAVELAKQARHRSDPTEVAEIDAWLAKHGGTL
jgi:tetratricopeptide (TPR) repeat protein